MNVTPEDVDPVELFDQVYQNLTIAEQMEVDRMILELQTVMHKRAKERGLRMTLGNKGAKEIFVRLGLFIACKNGLMSRAGRSK